MKKAFTLLLLFATTTFCFAGKTPKIVIKTGSTYQIPKGHWPWTILGSLEKGFVQTGFKNKKSISFQSFNLDLKQTKTSFLDLTALPKGAKFERFFTIKDKTFILYSQNSKGAGGAVFIQQINISTGAIVGKPKQLAETDFNLNLSSGGGVVLWFGPAVGAREQNVSIFQSTDSNRIGVRIQYPKKSKIDAKNKLEYSLSMYDGDLQKLWENKYEMPYTEKKMDIYDEHLDGEGNLLHLCRVYDDNSEKNVKGNKINYHFEIIKESKSKNGPVIIPFKFDDRTVEQIYIFEDLQKQVNICGYYGAKTASGKINQSSTTVAGAFLLRLDNSENKLIPIKKGMYEIPEDIVKQFETTRSQKSIEKTKDKGNEVAETNLKLREIIYDESGSITLIGEQFYITTYTVSNGRSSYTVTVYHYEDIIVQKIDAEGELAWTRKIPKTQTGAGGYKAMNTPDGINIFYMDNEKNLNIKTDQAPAVHSTGGRGLLMCSSISNSGDMKKFKIKDTRQDKEYIDIYNAQKVNDNIFITTIVNKKDRKLAMFSFE